MTDPVEPSPNHAQSPSDTAAASSSAPASPPKLERYRFAMFGGGIEEFDRYQVRDFIRKGEVTATTETALAGTDDWRKVAPYPELRPYLEMAATAPAQTGPVRASRSVPAETVAARLVPALLYPVAGGEVLVLLGIAICQSIMGVAVLMIPVTTVYMLAIIRATANGKTKMPAWVETDDIPAMFLIWLRTILVSLIALWPVLLWFGIWYFTADRTDPVAVERLIPGLIVAGLLSLIYYPACLATIAVWDSVAASLNPAFIFRVIRTMGSDYVVAIVAWVCATVIASLLGNLLSPLLTRVPFGSVPLRMLSIWAQFYGAHLLGWAVHGHSVELGWD
jgi:hypothetical protein